MIILLGDSHTSALGKYLRSPGGQAIRSMAEEKFGSASAMMFAAGVAFHAPFYRVDGQAVYLKARVPEKMVAALGNDGAIRPDDGNIYGFSFGFHASVILRQEFWKDYTILPDIQGKAYVSNAVFRQMVLAENKYILQFARVAKDLGVRFFFICSPPIRQAMLDRQAEFASPEELIAIKLTYQDVMMAAFDEIGAPYLLPPPRTHEDSVLKFEYDSSNEGDVHHANKRYGKLVWRRILEKVDTLVNAPILSKTI